MSTESQPRKPLPRDVVVRGWVSFFNDVSSDYGASGHLSPMDLS